MAKPSASQPTADPLRAEPVELVERRTLDSRTFLNPDGSYTTEQYAAPIHFTDTDGQLRPIETLAVVSQQPGAAFETKAGPVTVRLGDSSALGDPLVVVAGDHAVTYRPILPPGLSGAAAAADRAPSADGAHVTYPDVYPNVDLRYSLLPGGVDPDGECTTCLRNRDAYRRQVRGCWIYRGAQYSACMRNLAAVERAHRYDRCLGDLIAGLAIAGYGITFTYVAVRGRNYMQVVVGLNTFGRGREMVVGYWVRPCGV